MGLFILLLIEISELLLLPLFLMPLKDFLLRLLAKIFLLLLLVLQLPLDQCHHGQVRTTVLDKRIFLWGINANAVFPSHVTNSWISGKEDTPPSVCIHTMEI